jgi:hypothetical protein
VCGAGAAAVAVAWQSAVAVTVKTKCQRDSCYTLFVSVATWA